jgi:GNAT superfamily N-acetyltransferase
VDGLRIERVTGERTMLDWQRVHNTIIPTAPLTLGEVRERTGRHHLEVAYLGGVVVGCTTVRPPTDEDAATVIARVLPEYRGRGIGRALYERGLEKARAFGDERPIETVVLASNEDGLAFAGRQGFVEVERYVLPGDTIPFVTLRLPMPGHHGSSSAGR